MIILTYTYKCAECGILGEHKMPYIEGEAPTRASRPAGWRYHESVGYICADHKFEIFVDDVKQGYT